MEIYLIRHTTPDVRKGTCYGQADLDVTGSFLEEASYIKKHLPANMDVVYSSPLKRCSQLAEHLFPHHSIEFEEQLKEINCGEWELKLWDEIDDELVREWKSDFVNVCIPGGESYTHLYQRTTAFFDALPSHHQRIAIVSHGGVLRSILSHINKVALKDSFKFFKLYYGCVVKIEMKEDAFTYAILHNPVVENEQHRPSYT